jgi:4-methylaminobutanoate oxidase (formaldehyde-forming)
VAQAYGVRAGSISVGAAKERWPLMNADDVLGAVWSPDDGRVSPSDLCAALAKGARAGGAKIFEDTAVIGIVTEGGRVRAVETNAGRIACDAVALCTGLWSRRVAAMAGVPVPVWPCEHFYLLTKPVEGITGNMPTLSDHDGHLYIRDDSGGLLVGCFEPLGKPIDPALLGEDFAFQLLPDDWDHFEPMMTNALHRLPVLETAEVRMLDTRLFPWLRHEFGGRGHRRRRGHGAGLLHRRRTSSIRPARGGPQPLRGVLCLRGGA